MRLILGNKPSPQQLHAFMRCKLPENEPLVAVLRDRLAETKDALVGAEDTIRLYRLQGRAEILAALLEAIECSHELANRAMR